MLLTLAVLDPHNANLRAESRHWFPCHCHEMLSSFLFRRICCFSFLRCISILGSISLHSIRIFSTPLQRPCLNFKGCRIRLFFFFYPRLRRFWDVLGFSSQNWDLCLVSKSGIGSWSIINRVVCLVGPTFKQILSISILQRLNRLLKNWTFLVACFKISLY